MLSHFTATVRNLLDRRNYPFCRPLYRHLCIAALYFIIGTIGLTALRATLGTSPEFTAACHISLTTTCAGYLFSILEIAKISDAYRRVRANAKTAAELDQIYAQPPQILADEIAKFQAELDLLRQIVDVCEAELETHQNETVFVKSFFYSAGKYHDCNTIKARQSLNRAAYKLNYQLLGPEIELRQQALAAQQAH